jgi:cell wall-associated NlpC family hydrolase
MTTTDRTTEPVDVFDAHLARWEAAEADPDGTVERVARVIWLASNPAIPMVLTPEQIDSTWRHAQTAPMTAEYRQIAAAAIDALSKTEGQRYLVAKAAERLIGTAYDWQAIGEDALVDLGVPLAHIDWSGPNPPLHVICSSFAEWAYRQVGLARPEPSQGEALVQPGDWAAFDLAAQWNVAVKA